MWLGLVKLKKDRKKINFFRADEFFKTSFELTFFKSKNIKNNEKIFAPK